MEPEEGFQRLRSALTAIEGLSFDPVRVLNLDRIRWADLQFGRSLGLLDDRQIARVQKARADRVNPLHPDLPQDGWERSSDSGEGRLLADRDAATLWLQVVLHLAESRWCAGTGDPVQEMSEIVDAWGEIGGDVWDSVRPRGMDSFFFGAAARKRLLGRLHHYLASTVPVSGDETQSRQLNAALRVVGRLPRILNLLLFVVFTFAAWIGSHVSEWPVLYVTCVAVPTFVPFALSLRIKAYATTDTFIVRSYVREHRFRYDDVMGFSSVGYSGLWTGFDNITAWRNLGLWVIEVYRFKASSIELNATLMGPRASEKIADLLNARVPDEMPPGSVPGVV